MLPDTVAAVAADAAAAVAAAAAAAAAQGRRPLSTRGPLFVDGTSYLTSKALGIGHSGSASEQSHHSCTNAEHDDNSKDEEWQGNTTEQWRYLRLLSGHWSPWTVTAITLNRQRFPPAVWGEFRLCTGLTLLHLEDCDVTSAEFCSNMPNLRRLLLPHNQLRSLCGLKNLPMLEELCIKGNPIRTFRDLAQLSGLPSLRRLDLQAVDGSEWAPVCKERGYREAVLALLPRQPLGRAWNTTPNGCPRGSSTRLEIFDGQRLHLPPLKVAAAEVAAAAAETTASARLFRKDVQRALERAERELQKAAGVVKLAGALVKSNDTSGGNCQSSALEGVPEIKEPKQREQQQVASQLLVPTEACQALRELLSREVQETLSNSQQLTQQVRRTSAKVKRDAFVPEGRSPAAVAS